MPQKVSCMIFKQDFEDSVQKVQILKIIFKSYSMNFLWAEANAWLNINISHAINRHQN